MKKNIIFVGVLSVLITAIGIFASSKTHAVEGNFSLLVTPSPMITTVLPGKSTSIELKIRNTGTATEQLKIQTRQIAYDNVTEKASIDDTKPAEINQWVHFSAPVFTIKAGEWYTQSIRIDAPKEAGFSYSFAFLINRANDQAKSENGQQLKGKVAIFALINVDRPGAKRELVLGDFAPTQQLYEYLPTTFDVKFRNTGNTIIQPYGNVFIQRGSNDKAPITTLPVNDTSGYLLPGTVRTLHASWSDGFPVYSTSNGPDNQQVVKLEWNLDRVTHFRIGQYTAKIVAVYNDGTRDIPIIREVTFWVFPWKAALIILAVLAGTILLIRYTNKRRTEKAVRRALQQHRG